MRFVDTHALLLPREGVHVQWEIEPESDDLTQAEIEILRSESPNGPWVTLQIVDPCVTFSFTDRTAPWGSKHFDLSYKLVAKDKNTGQEIATCKVFGFQGRLPLDAVEIIRQHNILLRGVNNHDPITGIPTTVYKKRTFGPRCRECTDLVTGRVVISQCQACGGTGFESGYYTPIAPIYINFSPSPKILRMSTLGPMEENETTCFMTNFPILYANDMVVEPNEKHWRVVNIEVTERKRVTVHQLVRLREMDHNDVVYETHRHVDNQGD